MCGIVGLMDPNGIENTVLEKMKDSLVHRGPDDAGIWISSDRMIGLAHRRLSILDLTVKGRQPMSDCNGRLWITYNGEIYNFKEIRTELEAKDYNFQTDTDTEVILYAYKEWGVDCLSRFNGMFAFCIYDLKQQILFLARDRVGKKPLYYLNQTNKFIFASELKAILQDPKVSKEIDLRALNYYLSQGYIPSDLSIFSGITKLKPGHAMLLDIESFKIKIWRYWEIPTALDQYTADDSLIEELDHLLRDAIKLRMVSDVPLGVFLSGGLDSSLVVAMMSSISDRPVKAFSIGFDEKHYNELSYARIVAKYFGADLTEVILRPHVIDLLPSLVTQFDEPFADSSLLPTFIVSKVAREMVTVALSGDGGDEVFGGYLTYTDALRRDHIFKWFPKSLHHAIKRAGHYLPGRGGFISSTYDYFVDLYIQAYFRARERMSLFHRDILSELGSDLDEPETSRRIMM